MFGFDVPTTFMLGVYGLYFVWSATHSRLIKRWRNTQYGVNLGPTVKELAGDYKIPVKYYKSIAWCGFVTVVLSGLLYSGVALFQKTSNFLFLAIAAGNIVVGVLAFMTGSSYVNEYVRRETERQAQDNSTSSRQ